MYALCELPTGECKKCKVEKHGLSINVSYAIFGLGMILSELL